MKRLTLIVLVLVMLVLAVPVQATGGQGNGCPKGDGWYLASVGDVLEGFDQGNYKDQNGDGLVCVRFPKGFSVNQGQGGGTGAEAGSWVVKDNTN